MTVRTNDEKTFLGRLTEITEANLTNDQFGVNKLSRELGMSRSYVHRRLKSITNQSISQFICSVRLNKAMEMLEQNEVSAAEIAYEVGFSSPAYFNHCFHEHYGFPPGEFKKKLISDDTEENDVVGENTTNTRLLKSEIKESSVTVKKLKRKKLFLLSAIVFVVLSLVGLTYIYFISSNRLSGIFHKDKELSVAVLPLKNLSSDPNTQWLADGIMEDIVTRLSHIKEFTIKSRNSAEIYRNSTKSTRKIASELGVTYLVEGSILKEGDKVRIYVQLIDAKKDKHMWSDQYDRDLKGILTFISDISRQIAEELKYELSTAEKKQIEKVYTQSTEAYQLYLKGRYFWYRRTKEDFLKSVDYFNQALTIDPNYSLACAGLADAYFLMVWWKWYPWDEGCIKSKEYALKALNIDNHLSEAHAVLGGIANWFEKDWTLAERELNMAIECNPNFAVAHQYYGEYLDNRGNFIAALDQLNKAIQLNPNAPAMYRVRAGIYYNIGKNSEALNNTKKALELNQYYLICRMLNFRVYIRLGEDLKAIDELNTIISINDPDSDQANLLNAIYSKSGIEGIIHWTIDWLKSKDLNDNRTGLFNDDYLIASLYSFTSEWDSVMVHLERFSNSQSASKPRIKYTIDFKPLRNDPRFIALLKGMGLEDL